MTPTAAPPAPPTPTPTHSSPPTGSSAVTESARHAATSKPNSPTCRQPHRWPSVTTATSSSPPPRRSPTPSKGHPISRTLPTRAGIAITADVAVRDAMIAAAAQHTDTGAYLWTHIARRLRGQPRAEALTIAAACYCFLDDSIRAGIAADAALNEAQATQTPPPRLALMLLTALRSGIPPQQISRAIIDATTRD